MAVRSCYEKLDRREISRICATTACTQVDEIKKLNATSRPIPTDLSLNDLRTRIARLGEVDEEVYAYVVRSVVLKENAFVQTGSAPNFEGGLITLCSCKHSMRAARSPEAWQRGAWVAGLTSWNDAFSRQQSLVYLMRVGEAYGSQAELVKALRQSRRSKVVNAKDSTRLPLGDLVLPRTDDVAEERRHSPDAYQVPMTGHVHRRTADDDYWKYDVDNVGPGGRQSAMLVGDKDYSFIWTRPRVFYDEPGATRPYRKWTLSSLLNHLGESSE